MGSRCFYYIPVDRLCYYRVCDGEVFMIKLEMLYKDDDRLRYIAKLREENKHILLSTYVNTCIDQQRAWADRVISSETEQFYYVVEPKEYKDRQLYNNVIGYGGLIKIRSVPRTAEMSVLVNDNKYLEDAIWQLLKVGFGELNLNCIYAQVYETEPERIKLFGATGFRGEGILRRRKYHEGNMWDTHMMSILREEYSGAEG